MPFPNLTLLPGIEEPLGLIVEGAEGDELVTAAVRVFEILDEALRPHLEQLAPVELRRAVRWPELVVRASIWERSGGTDLHPWRLKWWASGGKPLGVCMGPMYVTAASGPVGTPSAGIGCGQVFGQLGGNRNRFASWCSSCQGQPAKRAKATLAQWGEAYARHGEQIAAVRAGEIEQIQEAWPRLLWRLTDLAERRQRKVSGLK